MELEELERDGTRPRTGHCREKISRAGKRLKNGDSGKKVYSREIKWREQCWSETELGLLGKL